MSLISIRELNKCVLSIWNPGGSDGSELALELVDYYTNDTGHKAAVIEIPCLGIPRLVVHTNCFSGKNIENYLLDLERAEIKTKINPIKYMDTLKENANISILKANPYASPDVSISHKLSSIETLKEAPLHLTKMLKEEDFDFLVLILQGQIYSPMTFFSLKASDHILINYNSTVELGWVLKCYERLQTDYITDEKKFSIQAHKEEQDVIAEVSNLHILSDINELFQRLEDNEQSNK